MGDFPLPRIKDFIRRVTPFDTLGEEELGAVVAHMEIAYFPRGEVIIRAGGPPATDLAIIQSGSVKVTLPEMEGGEILVDIRGEGETFGAVSLLQGSQALFEVTAREDVIAFLLPAAKFRELVDRHPAFKRHFSFSLARNLQAVQRNPATWFATGHQGDARGRAYVGNFGFAFPGGEPTPARLAKVDPDGAVHEAAADLMFPNGCVITPDGATLVVAESFAARLTAFDVAPDGTLSNRRLWAQLEGGAVPDGICLDAEGAIWVASPSTHEALRISEGGQVLDRVSADQGVFACMLGGNDRRTLFLATAADSDPAACRAARTGRIEAIEVDIPGAGLP
jgi:hypothetical protein